MAVIDEHLIAERASISRTLIVALQTSGINIPASGDQPAIPLALGELTVLETLASGRDLTNQLDTIENGGLGRDELAGFLGALRSRGLVAGRGAATPALAPARLSPERPVSELPPARMQLVLPSPKAVRSTAEGFEFVDHDGHRQIVLDARELVAAATMLRPIRFARAVGSQQTQLGAAALDDDAFADLVKRLITADLVHSIDPVVAEKDDAHGREVRVFQEEIVRGKTLERAIAASLEAHDATEQERHQRTGVTRTRIVPVQHNGNLAPLALGMLFAYAQQHDQGRLAEHYDFYPSWLTRLDAVPTLVELGPAIFLYSNYHWSHAENLAVSDAVKAASPPSINIHGGPDTPKYAADVQRYFELHPSVDITVHGEGEATFAELLAALADAPTDSEGRRDLSVLAEVAGLSFRTPDGAVHRTADRDRIAELDTIPSPYLTGQFDAYAEAIAPTAIIESNRGCPYGCTFCDWGSATLSRVRKYDLDRVLAELEWCAKNGVPRIFMADANFGIFERDVEIAEKVAELKQTYGYPKSFVTNYAKNTVKHLRRIVEVMVGAGIFTEGLLSLQSMNEDTLKTIKRSNIKLEKYEQLAREFRKARLPLYVDLMLGLPGSTVESFKEDLQQCVDREVTAKIFLTELLVNSPMNDPAYRETHQIETAIDLHGMYGAKKSAEGTTSRALLISTSSYSRSDYEEMKNIRAAFILCENYGVLRQVARHLRQSAGIPEVQFYDGLRKAVLDDRERLPHMAMLLEFVPKLMVSPVSWRLLLDEIRAYCVDVLGVTDDSALDTVFEVQHALLPARERQFPLRLELAHDIAAWHQAMTDAKDDGHNHDWTSIVPPLASFGPATFTIEDPFDVCTKGLGYPMDNDGYGNWEMQTAISRPLPARHLV